MKRLHRVIGLMVLFISSCQQNTFHSVYIVDSNKLQVSNSNQQILSQLLKDSGIGLADGDRLLMNGLAVSPDTLLANNISITIQIRRAVPVTIQTSSGSQVIQTSASTVGEAMMEAGIDLYATDFIDPAPDTPINGSMIIAYIPSREVSVFYGNSPVVLRSAAGMVGRALAEAGIPLMGLDYGLPSENEALPEDGQMRVVRVRESLSLNLKPVPHETEYVVSDKVELDQTEILQPGLDGLNVSRTRIRFEDGQQVSRQVEGEVVVRAPQKSVIGYGTKVVTHTISGTKLEYWRAVQMYATSYSPCRSGVSSCLSGTSLGLPVQKGVVAMKSDWYNQLQGQRVFIPGYGVAVVADVGGGYPDGRPWIDLGYRDSDWQEWGDWVTVYFLTPVPPNIPYLLK